MQARTIVAPVGVVGAIAAAGVGGVAVLVALLAAGAPIVLVVADAQHVRRCGRVGLDVVHKRVPDVGVAVGVGDVANVQHQLRAAPQHLVRHTA